MGTDEFELSLELSIGGSYGKSNDNPRKLEAKTGDPFGENDDRVKGDDDERIVDNNGVSRSDFSGFVDLQKRREIQALRRHEARMKREEKLKKSRGVNNGGPVLEDKLVLEAQQFRARVLDRESRETEDGVSEDSTRKGERNGRKEAVEDLNISLFSEDENAGTHFTGQKKCIFPQLGLVPNGINGFVVEKNEENVFRTVARSGTVDCESGNGPGDCAVERGSQAVSDYQSMPHKGGSNSDTESHSGSLATRQNPCASRSDRVVSGLSHDTDQSVEGAGKMTEKPKADAHSPNQTSNTCSTVEDPNSSPSMEANGLGAVSKPPKLPNHHHHDVACLQRVPCVSTMGNGPNSKTIMGFLYKYTQKEVSIMCVCHRRSFSPAGFVEHAGGVDISNPLRRITIVPPHLDS